jgi:curved DNA-binding protein CbpA
MSPHDRARATLGVRHDATRVEIDQAFRRLAMDAHPDRGGDTLRMADINAARDALLAPPDPIAAIIARRAHREPATYSEYLNLHRRCV